jgi:hypothetical protein
MGLIKKIDVPQYYAARRAMRLGIPRPVSQPKATEVSTTEAAGAKASATKFKKDFSLEHSSSIAPLPAQP